MNARLGHFARALLYKFGGTYASGIADPWGIVILSVPSLNRSFDETADGYHVGFHEFAHHLDLAQTRFDGTPSYLSDDSIRKWLKIVESEEERRRRGDSVWILMRCQAQLSCLHVRSKLSSRRRLRWRTATASCTGFFRRTSVRIRQPGVRH